MTILVPPAFAASNGAQDVSEAFSAWTIDNREAINKDGHVLFDRTATYRLERGVQTGLLHDVVFDGGATPGSRGFDGAHFIQKTKDPFGNLPLHHRGRNSGRSFFVLQKCTRVTFRGMRLTGCNDTVWKGTAGYDKHHENQDVFRYEGGEDNALIDLTAECTWGNGIELHPYVESDGAWVAPIGLWLHDVTFQNFGRQVASWTYGGHVIVDGDSYLGESARTLMDAEPTSSRRDTSLADSVQGVYLLGTKIGRHGLGMFAMHRITDVYVGGCTGYQIAPSGTAQVTNCIFEDNVSVHEVDGSSRYDFLNSTNVAIRRNKGLQSLGALVQFHGGDSNYQVADNQTRGAQFEDNTHPVTPKPFTDFTMTPPAHALRDAARAV